MKIKIEMMRKYQNWCVILGLLFVIGLISTPRAFAQTFEFESAECPNEVLFPIPFIADAIKQLDDLPNEEGVEGLTGVVNCGYVTVPENWDKPDGNQIQVAVAILRSGADEPEDDPVIYLEGGPGFGVLTDSLNWSTSTILQNRDLILVDQRGTGFSTPGLQCPNMFDQAHYNEEMSDEELLAAELEQLQICRDKFESDGIDLNGYHTPAIAADVEAIRIALGYEQINLYGISYGTRIALTMMRDFPDGIRSVVIDSVVPLQSKEAVDFPRYTLQQTNLLFESCAADPECNDAYPDLETVFNETVDRLNESPVKVTLRSKDGEQYTDYIDGEAFQGTLFMSMYLSDMLPFLPAMIYAVHQGDYTSIKFISLSMNMMFDMYVHGMAYSLRCAESEPFSDYDAIQAQIDQVDPRWEQFFSSGDLEKQCEIWDVTPLGAIEDQPVVSDIPTLVVSGEYDPITPPEEGDVAAETLSNHYLYVIPASGHGATGDGVSDVTCGQGIRDAFFDNPTDEPDASCIDEMDEPDYVTDVRPRRRWFKLSENLVLPANLALPVPTKLWVATGISLAIMTTVLLSAPIAWIKRLMQSSETRTPWRGRIPRYLIALITLLSFGFLIKFSTFVLIEPMEYLMVGPPSSLNLLLLIPWLTLLGTMGASWFTIVGWREKLGSVSGRVFYTIATIAAVVYHVCLWMFGFIG